VDLGIAGKRAAVAAASQGLGYAVAEALAREGVRVAMCSRRRDAIEDAAARIEGDVVPIVADVANVDGARGFVRDAMRALGGLDILVTNAGGPPAGTFATTDVDAYVDAFDLNCRGAIAMCKDAVPSMQAQQWGRVVAITSIAVRQPMASLILSNTARTALTAFLKTLAREVARDGVTVNSLQPGLHETERFRTLHGDEASQAEAVAGVPTGTLGDPADFGALAAFLCSQHARFVTGAAIPVDGGAYPGLL
jgi:3-oxoacyl-[acyl-carrier protein] reductase